LPGRAARRSGAEDRSPLLNVSAPTRAFLDKLVAADPKDRYPDAKAALAALDRPEAAAPPAKRRRLPWRYITVAAGVVAAGTGAGVMARHAHRSGNDAAIAAAVARLAYFEHEMCACRDDACTTRVTDDMIADRMRPTDPRPGPLAEMIVGSSVHFRGLGACMTAAHLAMRPEIAVAGTPVAGIPQSCLDYGAAVEQLASCDALPPDARNVLRAGYDSARANWQGNLSPTARSAFEEACRTAERAVRDAYTDCKKQQKKKLPCQDPWLVDPYDARPVCETRPKAKLDTQVLKITSNPWARVEIDGEYRGDTPALTIRLPLGSHHVVLRAEGYEPKTMTVKLGDSPEIVRVNFESP
jgi:hypothetical protein